MLLQTKTGFTKIYVIFYLFFCLYSTVHTVSALEPPLSAVQKDVLNSTITPAQGQLGHFKILEVFHSTAQNILNWQFTNVS